MTATPRRSSSGSTSAVSDAVPEDASRERPVEPGDDLGERRLARAVLAHERDHLAAADLERDAVERRSQRVRIREGHVLDGQPVEAPRRIDPCPAGRGRGRPARVHVEGDERRVVLDEQGRLVQRRRAEVHRPQPAGELVEAEHRRAGRGQRHLPGNEEVGQHGDRGGGHGRRAERAEERAPRAPARERAQFGDALVVEAVVAAAQESGGAERAHLLRTVAAREQALQVHALRARWASCHG